MGGPNGSIIVISGSLTEVFIYQALGGVYAWKEVPTPKGVSCFRNLRVFENNPNHLLIMGDGHLLPSTTNKITVRVVDLA